MSSWDRDLDNWLRGFFSGSGRIGLPTLGRSGGGWFGGDMSRQFEEMRREMERELAEQFKGIETTALKDLVREVGPLDYGYSMTIGQDSKPKVREFGNIRPSRLGEPNSGWTAPLISGEREPLADVTTTDKEVKVILEMSGVSKENININAADNSVEVKSEDPQRKYHHVVEIPAEADVQTIKSTFKNGVLEIIFRKKEQTKPKGKEVKVE